MYEMFLSNTNLFHGIRKEEITHLLSCLDAHEQSYDKNETILRAGSTIQELGLVESGGVNIIVNFYWGTSRIFGHASQGEIFGENYAAIPGKELLCDVVACETSLNLSQRMMHTAPRSLREKLLSYLSEQAMIHGSAHFVIPFDRQQLADYLGVDRSAMSAELSKKKKDGLISCRKNEFILHEMPDHL